MSHTYMIFPMATDIGMDIQKLLIFIVQQGCHIEPKHALHQSTESTDYWLRDMKYY